MYLKFPTVAINSVTTAVGRLIQSASLAQQSASNWSASSGLLPCHDSMEKIVLIKLVL